MFVNWECLLLSRIVLRHIFYTNQIFDCWSLRPFIRSSSHSLAHSLDRSLRVRVLSHIKIDDKPCNRITRWQLLETKSINTRHVFFLHINTPLSLFLSLSQLLSHLLLLSLTQFHTGCTIKAWRLQHKFTILQMNSLGIKFSFSSSVANFINLPLLFNDLLL